MSRKLHYFQFNGLAEPIRLMFHYGNVKFEDIRHDRQAWPIQSVQDFLPYGQMPLYEEGNRKLNQSVAIARYVASQCGLLPTDPWEQAVLDAAVFNIQDYGAKLREYIREPDPARKQALKKELLEQHIDFFYSRFEKELEANNGHFGGKLTWADFMLVGSVEATNLFLGIEVEKKYPMVSSLVQKVRSLPGVKEYVATRKPYVVPT